MRFIEYQWYKKILMFFWLVTSLLIYWGIVNLVLVQYSGDYAPLELERVLMVGMLVFLGYAALALIGGMFILDHQESIRMLMGSETRADKKVSSK